MLLALLLLSAPRVGAQEVLRIGLALPAAESAHPAAVSARMGAELGAEEAQRLAELLRQRVELVTAHATGSEATTQAARRLVEKEGVFAIVGGFDEETCVALGELAEREEVLFLNLGCGSDALRRVRCWSNTFHIAASDAMQRDALRAHAGEDTTLLPALWHASLYRYGATQLNDRFRERFDRPMDSHAWAGWFAVKMLTESALRARTVDAARLGEYMLGERTKFDGHKGRSLSFRSWDHQLRQPLYLLAPVSEGFEVAGEVPSGRPAENQTTEAFLDRIGDPPERTGCPREPRRPDRF